MRLHANESVLGRAQLVSEVVEGGSCSGRCRRILLRDSAARGPTQPKKPLKNALKTSCSTVGIRFALLFLRKVEMRLKLYGKNQIHTAWVAAFGQFSFHRHRDVKTEVRVGITTEKNARVRARWP